MPDSSSVNWVLAILNLFPFFTDLMAWYHFCFADALWNHKLMALIEQTLVKSFLKTEMWALSVSLISYSHCTFQVQFLGGKGAGIFRYWSVQQCEEVMHNSDIDVCTIMWYKHSVRKVSLEQQGLIPEVLLEASSFACLTYLVLERVEPLTWNR